MNKKILIVDDNKTLAKLIAKKIEQDLELEVDITYSLAETKLFLARYDYFLTFLDINLPDAPNGEVVDFVLNKKQKVIVLSGNIDKTFRNNMLKKPIIDYINKNTKDTIAYIIHTIKRLKKNQNHNILVVDDSIVFRKQMQNMLENMFLKVITVAHGEEALGMIKTKSDISLVLTDYNMPVMDGLELTFEIRKNYSKDELCILALSSSEDSEVSALFLKSGANDYIKKPFSKEEFSVRINNAIESLENIQTITNYANRDYLTGLYNRRYFYKTMSEYIENKNSKEFTVAMVDIDNFKNINDSFGHDFGDKVIVTLSNILQSLTDPKDVVSRFGGEEFCIVLKDMNYEDTYNRLESIRFEVQNYKVDIDQNEYINFTISIGAKTFTYEESLEESINEADMMLYKAKNNGKNQIVFEN